MEAILKAPAGEVQFIAAANLASGEVVQAPDGRPCVVGGLRGFSTGELAMGYTEGTYELLSASGTTFAVGAPVYWDVSANLAIAAAGDAADLYMGTAEVAKTSGQTVVRTILDGGVGSLRGLLVSRKTVIDHADATEHQLITAAQNPTGMVLDQFAGIITEQMAGTEDQLIITLYDDDDNALSTLTASDAAADAVGDIVQGTQTARGATGAVCKTIPAGKGAYAKVSQATTGAAAGAMRVWLAGHPL